MYIQQTSGIAALHDLSITSETVTPASPSDEPAEAPAELEKSPSQDELSPAAPSVTSVTTQPPFDPDTPEETDLPPEPGK